MIQKHPSQFTTPGDPRFDATDYVVRSTPQESHFLWYEWHFFYGVASWESEREGLARHIASLGERTLWVDVQWSLIGGKRVAFVSGRPGVLVDDRLIEEWCCAVFRCLRDIHYRPSRWADAANFVNILLNIKRNGGLVIRDADEVKRAVCSVEAKPWR